MNERKTELKEFIDDNNTIFIAESSCFLEKTKNIWYSNENDKDKDRKRWIFKGVKLKGKIENNKTINFDGPFFKSKFEECYGDFYNSINDTDLHKMEKELIRKFERQCQHYKIFLPKKEDKGYLLSVMRHYGAPVRLIDFTYSFFVAAYFSLNRPKNNKNNDQIYAVLAINDKWLSRIAEQKILFEQKCLKEYFETVYHKKDKFTFKNPEFFKRIYFRDKSEDPITFVHSYNPFHLNERLVVQQGLFLCPGDISKPFEANLIEAFEKDKDKVKENFYLIVFGNNNEDRRKILKVLYNMNINQATLFPGLQGFSESLSLYSNFPNMLISEGTELKESYDQYKKWGK